MPNPFLDYVLHNWDVVASNPLISAILFLSGAAVGLAIGRLWHKRLVELKQAQLDNYQQDVATTGERMTVLQSTLEDAQSRLKRLGQESSYDEEFEVEDSINFYNRVAAEYDHRNSHELRETHWEVIRAVMRRLPPSGNVAVLDLGGGTGNLVASGLQDNPRIELTYLDASPAMAALFKRNLKDARIERRMILGRIEEVRKEVAGRTFDIVVMCFVLSSMTSAPDWAAIRSVVKNGGYLIVADADPGYAALHPFFGVSLGGRSYGLRLRATSPVRLNRDIIAAGFQSVRLEAIMKEDVEYSFVSIHQAQ